MMKLYDLRTEYRENPIGLTDKAPRFSWKIESQEKDTLQTAYEISVTDENGKVVWNSGKRVSDQSVLVDYEGETLEAEMLYKVEVSVTDNHGNAASAEGTFETGILDNAEFIAQMLTSDFPAEETACPVFGKTFALNKSVKKARLYATAPGVYEVTLNGQTVGDYRMAPGMLEGPMIQFAYGMTLAELLGAAPQAKPMYEAVVNALNQKERGV